MSFKGSLKRSKVVKKAARGAKVDINVEKVDIGVDNIDTKVVEFDTKAAATNA